jgi:hypothetical protein
MPRTRLWLLASATALAGSAVAAGVSAGTTRLQTSGPLLPPGLPDSDFILCHAPGQRGLAGSPFRLAATQTEVPPTEMQAAVPSPDFASTYPPLRDGLGTLTYKITTSDPQAQAYFDQGLRLAYGFNHDEARRAFHEAQHRDPDCAMCFWGEALALLWQIIRGPGFPNQIFSDSGWSA